MAFFGLIGSRRHERAGFALYTASVQAARDPVYFERLSVPDTLDGRFDLIGLFAALLIRRVRLLPPPGPALAQAVFDAMFADMDFSLRESGVGEMSGGRKIREMWEAFHGRAMAYEAPLGASDHAALTAALGRNVWRGAAPPGCAEALAGAALAQDGALAGQTISRLGRGAVPFLPAAEAKIKKARKLGHGRFPRRVSGRARNSLWKPSRRSWKRCPGAWAFRPFTAWSAASTCGVPRPIRWRLMGCCRQGCANPAWSRWSHSIPIW